MPVQAPIQNQSYLNKNVAFFAPASTLGASELGTDPNLQAGFLNFGLQGGGVLSGVGLNIVGVSTVTGPISTLGVVANNPGSPKALAAAGVYFDTVGGALTTCSLIKQSPLGNDTTYLYTSNLGMRNLAINDGLAVSTLNGIPVVVSPASALYTVQAGLGNTIASNAAIVTFATPYSSASTLSITATPINTLNNKFHPLTLSAISQSTFVITTDAIGVSFSWIANGPV